MSSRADSAASTGSTFVRTACPMDCPDACSLEAETRDGRVVALRAGGGHSVTQGFMCAKMTHYPERMYGADRILTPLRRVGPKGDGRFVPVSWDEALDAVARLLERTRRLHGGEAILPYHYDGSNGVFAHDAVDGALWRALGACEIERTLCAAPASTVAAALYGKMAGVAFPDYVDASLIVLWGANPSVSNTHLVPYLEAARKRGAKLVALDPRRTPFAAKADLHLALRPGTDLCLALALAAEAERRGALASEFLATHATGVEALLAAARPWTLARAAAEAGVEEADLRRFADLYFAASPAVLRLGWGPERNRNGDGAMAAILALPALLGKFGVRGGGYTLSNSGAFRTASGAMTLVPEPAGRRVVNMSALGRALAPEATPAVRVLFVYDANPMVSTPETEAVRRGLLREDLTTIVFEQVMTDTARYADLVLPAATFLEQNELHRGYGALVLQRIVPAAPMYGEGRPNEHVFAELAARLGFRGEAFSADPETLAARFLRASAALPGEATARLARDGVVELSYDGKPGPVQFVNSFPNTPDAKIRLDPPEWRRAGLDVYAYLPDPTTPQYPLALLSSATARTINSTLGDLDRRPQVCSLHPEEAAARGVAEGDLVRVFNEQGSLTCPAHVDATQRRGTVSIPKGVWLRNTREGRGANALISAGRTVVSGGAVYNDARVQVEAAKTAV
jgi:anaerobic selenocysteine-containing dehydrogenase